MSKATIERELKKLDKEYTSFYTSHIAKVKAVKAGYKNLYHKCVNCKKRTQLGKLIMVVEKYCPDPESWAYETDTRFLICPHCTVMNRFYSKNKKNFIEDRTVYLKTISWLPDSSYFHRKKVEIYGEELHLELLKYRNAE